MTLIQSPHHSGNTYLIDEVIILAILFYNPISHCNINNLGQCQVDLNCGVAALINVTAHAGKVLLQVCMYHVCVWRVLACVCICVCVCVRASVHMGMYICVYTQFNITLVTTTRVLSCNGKIPDRYIFQDTSCMNGFI